MKQGKIWGETELIFKNCNFEIHRIKIKKGGYCSKHLHQHKYNMFFVEKGELEIYIEKNDYQLIDEVTLKDGEKTNVKPNEYHFFMAKEDTTAYEIYYTEQITDDIIRKNHGGIK